jgi:hypothetical protein
MRRQTTQPGAEFTTQQAQYAEAAVQASGGAAPVAGMAPYPLYGIPLGQENASELPFYQRPWPMFFIGAGATATLVGGAYAYFRWWRPMRKRMTANELKTIKQKLSEIEKREESA